GPRAPHHAGGAARRRGGVPRVDDARDTARPACGRARPAARAGAGDARGHPSAVRAHRDGARGLRIVTVIGNRPQFVKAAAVSRALRERHEEVLVHTGQHYDDELSTVFVEQLGIPRPDRELGLGRGTNTEQTARMLAALGPLLQDERAVAVLVYGDTNSTLAG